VKQVKEYIAPLLECIQYKVEERLATTCTGSCPHTGEFIDSEGNPVYLISQSYSG